MNLAAEFLSVTKARAEEIKKLGEGALRQLNEEQVLWIPNDVSNSVSILVKHISGNMISRSTDFLTTEGEKEDRNRDGEFEGALSYDEMMATWDKGWEVFLRTLESLDEADVEKNVMLRGESLSVIDALTRQIAHYSGHVNQIVYIGKMIKSEDWSTLSIPKKKA